MKLIDEQTAKDIVDPAEVVEVLEEAYRFRREGSLIADMEARFPFGPRSLVVTASDVEPKNALGVRISGKFPDPSVEDDEEIDYLVATPRKTDVMVVFNRETSDIMGLVTGTYLPDMRTGGLGGIAVKHLARPDSSHLGVIGSGRQARTQLEAISTVRDFDVARVYSRTPENRETFANRMNNRLDIEVVAVDSSSAAVTGADVLVCATTSPEPVFDPVNLESGTHINSIGPHWNDAHEIDIDVVERSSILATDSLVPLQEDSGRFFLTGTGFENEFIGLDEFIFEEATGRTSDEEITFYCPMGAEGFQIPLAAYVLQNT